jgi:DNA polymerase elongation subunit (family B)
MKQQLRQKDTQHQALQQKYAEQREQWLEDKQLVDDWSEEVASIDAFCKEVEGANQDLEDRLVRATEKHQVDTMAKDGEIVILKTDQELVIAAKDVETEYWRRACSPKNATLQETVAQLTAERNEIKRKANLQKKKI